MCPVLHSGDRERPPLNSRHTEIYALSLHDALPISFFFSLLFVAPCVVSIESTVVACVVIGGDVSRLAFRRSGEATAQLQTHRDLRSFPTRRSSDLIFFQPPVRRTMRRKH